MNQTIKDFDEWINSNYIEIKSEKRSGWIENDSYVTDVSKSKSLKELISIYSKKKINEKEEFPELNAIAYDGGLVVHTNGFWLEDCKNLPQRDIDMNRYAIRKTSKDHWAVFEGDCRLSKEDDCFIYSGLPSGRSEGFIEDTTWSSPIEAFYFLEKWKIREKIRFFKQLEGRQMSRRFNYDKENGAV